jgi:hypothetical protein
VNQLNPNIVYHSHYNVSSNGLPNSMAVVLLSRKQDRMLISATRNRGAAIWVLQGI